MRPTGLTIEVECINCPLTLLHIEFIFWCPFGVEDNIFVETGDLRVALEFSVNLTAVRLINASIANSFVVKPSLLLQPGQEIRHGPVSRYQNLINLLFRWLVFW